MMLGDLIESALASIGVTPSSVERWIGKPCNCQERKDKLNALSSWAMRITTGRKIDGKQYLERLMN